MNIYPTLNVSGTEKSELLEGKTSLWGKISKSVDDEGNTNSEVGKTWHFIISYCNILGQGSLERSDDNHYGGKI